MSDDQLYSAYLDGDLSAGDQLMLRYGDELTAFLNAFLNNLQDAEDLMLECFTVILVDKPRIREGSFRAYLYKVARNKARRLFGLRYKRREFCPEEVSLPEAPSAEEIILDREYGRALQRCLNRIAPQYREALWLTHCAGMSYDQAALVLHCNLKRIDNLLYNGRKQLRIELEREGFSDA